VPVHTLVVVRPIDFAPVCRDGSNEIAVCPAVYTDVHSKEATVTIAWTIRDGITNFVQHILYVTNWDSREWVEDTVTDFSDGIFTDTEVSSTLGDGDGAITLTAL